MAIYSINDLENLSGIKAHTLRIWEQRYDIIQPRRTPTNIRYYDDDDLRHILNIALLNKNGYKISKIAKMTASEIQEKVAAITEVSFEQATQLDALTLSVVEMDESKFDRIVKTHIQQIGFEKTMTEVVYPFLEKLSLLWLTGSISPVQESFMSHLIRQKIMTAIENERFAPEPGAPKIALYLPEGERQELSLLFLHYLIKSRKLRSYYLGLDVSLSDLSDAIKICKPDYVFTLVTESFSKSSLQAYLNTLNENFPPVHIPFSAYQVIAQNLRPAEKITTLNSLGETIHFLEKLKSNTDDQPVPSSSR